MALQVHAVNGLFCKNVFNSSQIDGTRLADSVAERLKSATFNEFDQNVLRVRRFTDAEHLQGFWLVRIGIKEMLFHLNRSEIQRLSSDSVYAETMVQQLLSRMKTDETLRFHFVRYSEEAPSSALSKELVQQATRIFFAYEYIMELSRDTNFYSPNEFRQLATIEGLPVKNFQTLYRFDSRDKKEIAMAGGFYPNPNRARGILIEHSKAGVGFHGAGFVSLSVESGNEFNLKIWPVLNAAMAFSSKHSDIEAYFPEMTSALTPKRSDSKFEILKTNEYLIHSVSGVVPDANSSIAEEKEIVTPFVSLEQIHEQRDIYILAETSRNALGDLDYVRVLSTKHGEWNHINSHL